MAAHMKYATTRAPSLEARSCAALTPLTQLGIVSLLVALTWFLISI